MKEKVNDFINVRVKKAWAPTIVVTLIFLVTYFGFGMENTMIGPFATLSFLRFRNLKNHYGCMLKTFAIYIVMALVAYVAMWNIPLCMIANAAALFWICAELIDEYQMDNYFPPGMALIFFQIAPVYTPAALGNRILALAAAFAVIFVFLVLLNLKHGEDTLEVMAADGQNLCYRLYKAMEADKSEDIIALQNQICEKSRQMSSVIYNANRASFVMYAKVNMYCRYVGLFETFLYEARSEESKEEKLQELEKILQRIAYLKANEIEDGKRLDLRSHKIDLSMSRYRFAMRQVIIVMPCLVFAYVSQWPNAYWLTISVFFMMIPFSDNTKSRVRARVFGTLRGIIFCMVLFYIFRTLPQRVVIMTIFNFLIYTAEGYASMVSYITCSALALNALEGGVTLMLLERIIYTFIGAGITLWANRCIFPVRPHTSVASMEKQFDEIKYDMSEVIPYIEDRQDRWHRVNERVIKACMLGNTFSKYDDSPERRDYIRKNMMYIVSCIKEKIH